MKNKIIAVREKYHWDSLFEIIMNKNADAKDRLFMVLMSLWYIPAIVALSALWLILYIPFILFCRVDKLLH